MTRAAKWLSENLTVSVQVLGLLGVLIGAASVYFVTRTYADATYASKDEMKEVIQEVGTMHDDVLLLCGEKCKRNH